MPVTLQATELQQTLFTVFTKLGFNTEQAQLLAETHTHSTLCGVHSHGVNRVPVFADHVVQQVVKVNVTAKKVESLGAIERWDGQFGAGVVNATRCTARSIELAKQNGLGLVALRNTNHWMRAGSYGLQAAKNGCIGIMFTNTEANMPPWGGAANRIGNNPLVIAIPNQATPVILDMAMSQFSFGKIQEYQLREETLPFHGGWDKNHQPTVDPEQIIETGQAMPAGYWKGSSLSMVLDMLATLLSAGNATHKISKHAVETGVSQIFMCIDTEVFGQAKLQATLLNEIISYTTAVPTGNDRQVKYPGQRSQETLEQSLKHGVSVDESIWRKVFALAKGR